MDEPAELIEFLAPYPQELQEEALKARQFLFDLLSPVTELHYDATAAVCAGFGYTPRLTDYFVNIAVYSSHMNLVFPWGGRLQDPERRLVGEGARVRHIKLRSAEDLKDPYVLDLISQAAESAPRRDNRESPTRVVKIYEGAKRRPKQT